MKISRYIASYWNIVKYRLYRKKTVLLKGGPDQQKDKDKDKDDDKDKDNDKDI